MGIYLDVQGACKEEAIFQGEGDYCPTIQMLQVPITSKQYNRKLNKCHRAPANIKFTV